MSHLVVLSHSKLPPNLTSIACQQRQNVSSRRTTYHVWQEHELLLVCATLLVRLHDGLVDLLAR